jgi:hypothetical protein
MMAWALPDELETLAAAENLTPEQYLKRFHQNTPPPPWALTPEALKAEMELALVGQRRSRGRPKKPGNSNDSIVALLREHRAADFNDRFTLSRADATRRWLERRGIHKSNDALIKLIHRAKRPKRS